MNASLKTAFTPAHTGYVSTLSRFGPSLFLNSSRMPFPGEPGYNAESALIVHTILQNLKLYTAIGEKFNRPDTLSLTQQLHALYQVYEVGYQDGDVVPIFYIRPPNDFSTVPQDKVSRYLRIDDPAILSEQDPKNIF